MKSAETLTLRQLNRATLARQMLLKRERVTPLAAIERLVGMQAQLPRPPFVGLWGRVEGFRREDLTKLLVGRQAVRATFLRGTLHVSSARDFVLLRPTMQPVLDAGIRAILKARGARVDPERLTRQAREILAEGPQTFQEVRDRLKRADPGANERALGFAVRMLLPVTGQSRRSACSRIRCSVVRCRAANVAKRSPSHVNRCFTSCPRRSTLPLSDGCRTRHGSMMKPSCLA